VNALTQQLTQNGQIHGTGGVSNKVNRMPYKKPESDKSEKNSGERMPTPATQQPSGQMQRSSSSNHVFVGQKPVMTYAMSALIQLAGSGDCVVKARGMAISRAVDVAEIVTKRFGNGQFKVKDIVINTEVVGEGAEMRNISSIEIVVGK
jgi:archaea-specific DNA-binding protein